MDIISLPDFISQEDADALVSYAIEQRNEFEYFAPDHRYRLVNCEIPLINELVAKYGAKIQELCGPSRPNEVSDWILSIYEVGAFMNVHKDDTMPDYGRCYFTGVIYLNDDYEGGEIHFPVKNVKHKPQARTAIAFGGELDHGVLPVLRGTRYILGIGFTDDPEFFTMKGKA
jgi:hypothetical protein